MATVSRLILAHPALGTAGGAGLHASVEALYQKIGDAVANRWYQLIDFDQTEVVDLEHNFDTDIENLRWDIYVFTGGQWMLLTDESSPLRSAFTVAEKAGFEDLALQITNVSGGNDLLAAVVVTNDPLALEDGDIKDVDITTTAPQDGQALVYEASSDKWKPGASGDASFKIQSVATPSAVIKGGFLPLVDGRELATYDGAGTLSTDYGKDLTINLTTVLGGAPANATAYYLYIDLQGVPAAAVTTDDGRSLVAVQQANFVLLTGLPSAQNRARYARIGVVRSATTGNAWSGAGAAFATVGAKLFDNGPVAVNPTVYRLAKKVVGAVGTAGQVLAGHFHSLKTFASLAASTISWFNLSNASGTDGSANGRNLTGSGSPSGGIGIDGVAATGTTFAASVFAAGNVAHFNPGNSKSFSFGGWVKPSSWTTLGSVAGNFNGGADQGFFIEINSTNLAFVGTNTAGTEDYRLSIPNPFTGSSWHHLLWVFDHANQLLKAYIDGKLAGSMAAANMRALATNDFRIGNLTSGGTAFAGVAGPFIFYNSGVSALGLTDEDIRRLYATRIDHNTDTDPEYQEWSATLWATTATQDERAFLVDKSDRNSAFIDLDVAATDSVALALKNTGLTPTVIPPSPPFDQTYTANPTFPISHGQTGVPEVVAMQEVSAGTWEPISLTGHVNVTSTQLTGSLAALFTGGATSVRIVARSAQTAAVAVSAATATTAGLYVAGAAPGAVSGAAIAAGNVGQQLTGTFLTPTYASGVAKDAMSLVLPAGVWLVYGKFQLGAAGTTMTASSVSLSTTSNTANNKTKVDDLTATNTNDRLFAPLPLYINTTGTTVYLVALVNFTGAAPVSTSAFNELYAVRIQ